MKKESKASNENKLFENIKIKDEKYLEELQRFLDFADNISNEDLKKRMIYQMLKCDKRLTEIFEKNMKNNK